MLRFIVTRNLRPRCSPTGKLMWIRRPPLSLVKVACDVTVVNVEALAVSAAAISNCCDSGTTVASGSLKYRETIAQGIEAAPEAFFGLLKGKNFGKQLVKLI